MCRVSDDEVEFILNDIKQRGVEMEDLQNNLLDHICCLLEKEKKENEDFETAYQKVIKQFFKHALWEIEEETILLLKYRNYYKMKRFLYILLFLSIGYNVFIFSKMGYEYYRQKEYFQSICPSKNITLKEGYNNLVATLKKEHPEALGKKYMCVYFPGDPMSDYEKERFFEPYDEDTTNIKARKLHHYSILQKMDSVAGVYNKNVAFVYAYNGNHKNIIKQQMIDKYIFKNGYFINNQYKLYSGFCNERKDKVGFVSHLFVLNKDGKIIYVCKYIIEQHIFLSRFLKTLPK